MPADKDAKIACPSAGHLQSELEALSSTLALTEKEETWEKLEKALIRFAAVTRGGGYKHLPLYVEGVGRKGSGPEICSCMISDRGRLSGVGIDLLQTMAPRLGAGFAPLVQLYMEPILKLLGRPNKVVLKRTEKCLDLMISHCHLPSLVTELKKGLSDDAATCRRGCAIGIEKAMSTWDKSVWTAKNVVMLEEGVRKMAVDKDPAVRQTGKKVWGVFQDLWPERVEEFSAPLTPTIRRYLDIANPNGPAKAKPKPKPVVRAAPAPAAHPAVPASGPSTALPPAQRSTSASSSSSSIPPSAPLPKPARTVGITSKPSRLPLDPSTSSIDSMLPPRPQPHSTDNEGTSRAPSRPPYQSHNVVSHFPAPQRSVSHGTLPTSQAATFGEVWTKPSRPGIHSSHSTASLPDHDVNTHSVPQRRFPPPTRVGRLPSTMEDTADTVDFFGPSLLRGPVRIPPLPATRLGPAQRRVVTAPPPTATLSTSTSAPAVPYPTAQSVKKRVAELEEEIASNPSSPIPQPHPPSRPNSTGVSPFNSIKAGRSPVNLRAINAAFAQPGVPMDSPLLPVLMRSTTSREEIARERDGFEQSDLRNEEELEAEGNSTVVSQGTAPVPSPQGRQEELDVGQSATSGQVESAATAPKVEIEDTQLPFSTTQCTSGEENVTSEVDLGLDCPTALPVQSVEPTLVAIPAVSEKPLAGEARTGPVDKDVPAPEPAQLPLPPSPIPSRALSPIAPIQLDDQALAHMALVDQLVTAKAAVCDKLPTVTSLSKSTTKSAIQTQPRAVSATRAPPPTATSSSAARPPKPPVPRAPRGVSTDRRPFRPTSQTASSSGAGGTGGTARQVSNPKTKDATGKGIAPLKPSITGSSTVSASASTTARVAARVPSATLSTSTSASAPASASAARKPPVSRVTKKPATTVSGIPPASDVQAGTEDAAPTKATARPGKTAPVALPPVRKERVSRKPPIPPFIPIRGGGGGTKSKATVSTSTTGKASSGIVAKSRPLIAKVKPESIPLPLSPAERAKLPPKDIPLPRSPREVIDDIPDTPPRPLAHIAQPSKGLELVLGSPSKSRSPINLKPPRVLSPVLTTVPPTAIAPIPSPKPQNETAPVHLAEYEVEGGGYGDISFDGSIPSPYLLAGRLRGEEQHVDRSIHHTDEAGEVLRDEGVTASAARSHDGHILGLAEPELERQLVSQDTQSSPTIAQTSPITINTRRYDSRTSTPAAIEIPTISPRPAFGERIDVVNTPQRAEGLLAKLAMAKTSPSPGERKVLRVRDANVRGDMEGDGSLGADDRDIQ